MENVFVLMEANYGTKLIKCLSVHRTDKGAQEAMAFLVDYVIGDDHHYVCKKTDAVTEIQYCDDDGKIRNVCRYYILQRTLVS